MREKDDIISRNSKKGPDTNGIDPEKFKEDGKMSVNTINAQTDVYAAYKTDTTAKKDTEAKTDTTAKTEEKNESGVVYEKTDSSKDTKKATYSINKMSAEDRAALVQQMKADTQSRQQQLISIVQKMMTGQAATSSIANGTNSDDVWKFLAKGNFTVDAATKAQAQQDISEDGYYGVKQTSERLFDFASALAGDDVEKMKKMQAAMQKGFKEATGAWGKDLPDICQKTLDAANKKFEDYYKSKELVSDNSATEA